MNTFQPIYMHHFTCKYDITYCFEIEQNTLDDANVLIAYYHCGPCGCDSSAFVLYEQDGKLWEVNGDHCSCHGLEDQWEPEEVTVEELEHRLERGNLGCPGGYDEDGFFEESKAVVAYLKAKGR